MVSASDETNAELSAATLCHYGRIFKTLHVLAYVDADAYRRQIKGMRNLQEGRHDLARHVFHGGKGELRQHYHEGIDRLDRRGAQLVQTGTRVGADREGTMARSRFGTTVTEDTSVEVAG